MRTSPARGSGSGTVSYLSTSGGPNSWMTIAFIRFLCLHHLNHRSASGSWRLDACSNCVERTSIDLHAGVAHDALPFDRVVPDQGTEFGRGHVGGVDEVGLQPLFGLGIAAERTHIPVELLDDVVRRSARCKQREPG